MLRYFLFLLVSIGCFSCKQKLQKENNQDEFKSLFSVEKKHVAIKKVKPAFKKQVENWEQLNTVSSFLSRFEKASPNEILGNALELESLVKTLKDTVKPPVFDGPSMQARIHILHNETLRLSDMTFIPAITAAEVHEQTNKIIHAFSAVNAKINTILQKKQFDDAIQIDVNFIGLDSTKIDSVSKISVQNNLQLRTIKKNTNLRKQNRNQQPKK